MLKALINQNEALNPLRKILLAILLNRLVIANEFARLIGMHKQVYGFRLTFATLSFAISAPTTYSIYLLCCSFRKYLPKRSSTRFVGAQVLLEDNLSFILTCVHLNHTSEETRLSELNEIITNLYDLRTQSMAVMAGDFNALTLEDYSSEELNHITQVRANNRWEKPKRALTDRMKQVGFTDSKVMFKLCFRLIWFKLKIQLKWAWSKYVRNCPLGH